jgi:hypothetical protein
MEYKSVKLIQTPSKGLFASNYTQNFERQILLSVIAMRKHITSTMK